ncbi:MAG: hypothetical protein SW127_20960, partial [Actinomycetota bacterium]|nr:hypothetical protein [Actinomycetota bacterium]
PTAGNSISGLHANLFGVERGSQVSLFVGSTTATHAAFAGDLGFLVQLHGRAKTVGIDVLLGEDALGSVLVRSVPGDDRLPAERSSAEDLESYLREIASIPIDITVRRTGPAYDFSVSSTDPVPSRPGVAITVAPLTAPSRTRRVKPAQPISCGFDGLDKADITAFFVVRVKARRRGSHASAVIKARLEQDVVGRATAVAREEIPTPEAFRALLDILLPVMPAEAAGDRHRTSIPSQPNPNVPQLGIGLFEMLTQTAAQWPKRFDSIRDIVDDIIGDDDPDGILPPGFRELWQTINDAVGEVTSASE